MIDVQALASACGLEPRGSDYDRATGRWDEDTDLHIVGQDGVSLPFLRAFASAVLEDAGMESWQLCSDAEFARFTADGIQRLKLGAPAAVLLRTPSTVENA